MKNKLNRIISIILVLTLFAGCCMTASAVSESDYTATFRIVTDKSSAKAGDIVTVSVLLKTNYYIYTMSLPIIYDASIFEIQNTSTTNLKSFLTFEGRLKNNYSKNGNWQSPDELYTKRNSNPDYWSSDAVKEKYKIASATWTADSSISTEAVKLSDEETILSFKLKATKDIDKITDKIFISTDFQKTEDCKGGYLFVGRSEYSFFDVTSFVAVGQTIIFDDGLIDIAGANVSAINDTYETGSAITPEPNVYFNSVKLTKGTDYQLTYENNINVGKAAVIISGIGNYKGSKTVEFNIVKSAEPVDISSATVSEIQNVSYSGSAITPEPDVYYNSVKLTKGTDYQLTYENNINVGKASVIISGIGNYKGSKTVEFNIVKPATSIVLSNTNLSINYKSTAKLLANILPENADCKKVVWSSSDSSVVSVDQDGNIYGAKRGSAVITATASDGSCKASCTVDVNYSVLQWLIVILLFGWIWY